MIWRDVRLALADKVFWLLLATVVLGFFNQSPWVLPLLAVLLTLWSVVSDTEMIDRFRAAGELPALAWFWLGCLAHNLLYVGAAFVVATGLRWAFW